jgi:hypothetical protein
MGEINPRQLEKFKQALDNFPGYKAGRHPALLGVSNHAAKAGLSQEEAGAALRRRTADAPMDDREYDQAITKAYTEHTPQATIYRFTPRPKPLVKDGNAARQHIIDQGTISEDVDLWECSSLRLMESCGRDSVLLLKTHFRPGEFIYIGGGKEVGVLGQNIRTAAEWVAFFEAGGTAGPYIIVNPLSGEPAPKKDGDGDTYRGDGNVKTFRHCLVEFDDLTRENQIRFWSAAKLPVLALIDSGGKSIHAWLDVRKLGTVSTADEWDAHIKRGLYDRLLTPLGVDRACSNPARLSRLPGCIRTETGRAQRLLWLSPEGREVVR